MVLELTVSRANHATHISVGPYVSRRPEYGLDLRTRGRMQVMLRVHMGDASHTLPYRLDILSLGLLLLGSIYWEGSESGPIRISKSQLSLAISWQTQRSKPAGRPLGMGACEQGRQQICVLGQLRMNVAPSKRFSPLTQLCSQLLVRNVICDGLLHHVLCTCAHG